jgi:HJR/Mrr/RecB family endonuclease
MARRYRNYKRNDPDGDLVGIIASIFGLYALYLLLLYFTNRAEFWRWTVYGALAVIVIFVIAVAVAKLKTARKERYLQKLLAAVRQAGMEDQLKNFFIRFGMGQDRSKNAWEYRNYKIDWKRFHEMEDILRGKGVRLEDNKDLALLLRHYIDEREFSITSNSIQANTKNFRELNGPAFEALLLRLYEKMGYAVQHTGKTGDQGGDLVATKGGERLLIQAKCYQNISVGNDAVQQAVGARTFYDCNKAAVITNSEFTREAVELAKANNVELIAKARLQQLLLDNLSESWA